MKTPLLTPLGTNTAANAVSTTAAEWQRSGTFWNLMELSPLSHLHPTGGLRFLLLHAPVSGANSAHWHGLGYGTTFSKQDSLEKYSFQLPLWEAGSVSLGGESLDVGTGFRSKVY